MHIEFNKEMRRRIMIYSASLVIGILAYFIITQFGTILKALGSLFGLVWPFLLGAGIAFVLNRPVLWFQDVIFARLSLRTSQKRILAVAVVFVLFLLFLALAIAMIIPNLFDSVRKFVFNFSGYMDTLEVYMTNAIDSMGLSDTEVNNFVQSLDIAGTLSRSLRSILPQLAGYSFNVVRSLMNFFISLASAFYILVDKRNLVHAIKILNYSLFSKEAANYLTLFSYDAKIIFEQYIVGNLIDSLVVGIICWFGCFVFSIPYAPMIGFIVGITNIIPVFGPFLGAIPVIILLLLINPVAALIFAIFILILQQVDGNILKPIILGDKMGLSGFWILFSVTIGGSLFGVLGMFLAVPVFALTYAGIEDIAKLRLAKKNIDVTDEPGIIS